MNRVSHVWLSVFGSNRFTASILFGDGLILRSQGRATEQGINNLIASLNLLKT